ncbi:MAG: hypothetical protein FWJ70_06025 [Micromonosporaceae bacterium]|jgi:hypothetical protein
MSWREAPLVERFAYYATRLWAWARRVRPAPLALRVVVWVSGVGALVPVLPSQLQPATGAMAVVALAALAAGFPGSWWVGSLETLAVVLLALAVWLGEPLGLPVVAGCAALLYVHHTAAALAATLRTDALVPAAVLRRYVVRTAGVLAASAVLAGAVATVPEQQPGWSPSLFMAVAAAAAVAATAALVYLAGDRWARPDRER